MKYKQIEPLISIEMYLIVWKFIGRFITEDKWHRDEQKERYQKNTTAYRSHRLWTVKKESKRMKKKFASINDFKFNIIHFWFISFASIIAK